MYVAERKPHGGNGSRSLEDLEKTIVIAVEVVGGRPLVRRLGVIDAEWSKRDGKHTASVEVSFDAQTFNIRYLGSYNLGYDPDRCVRQGRGNGRKRRGRSCGPVIHPQYNEWVRGLQAKILERVAASLP